MRIIGTTQGGYLLDASREEVHALSGGKVYDADQYGNTRIHATGTTFDVAPVWAHMNRLAAAAENAKKGGSFLRGLADILDTSIPDWIADPAPKEETAE